MYDPECVCGAPRSSHKGKLHGGQCSGHDTGKVLVTRMELTGPSEDVGVPGEILDTQPVLDDCPDSCIRFRYAEGERRKERAFIARDDDPNVAMHEWDAARPRSGKTQRARAEGKFGVGPSDHSSCHKAIEFRERPPEGLEIVPTDKSAAIAGTLFHDALTEARRARYPWRQFGVMVNVPGLDSPGEIDEYDPITGRVTDYKSAGQYKWDKTGREGPGETDWKQAFDYALGLADDGQHVTEVEILYIDRNSGRQEPFVRPFTREVALAGVNELHAIMDALEAGDPLPRVRAGDELLGPTVNALCAKWCPYVKTCWSLDEVPPERTPEGWLLARDDADGDIEKALDVYVENRDAASAAAKHKDYAKTLVEGVEKGRYGDYTLNWTGGNTLAPQPDNAARNAILEAEMDIARQEQRPPMDPADLPFPAIEKRSSKQIKIDRVRKAILEMEAAGKEEEGET